MNYYKATLDDYLYYYAVEDGIIVRQIAVVDGVLHWATLYEEKTCEYMFTDQLEFVFTEYHESISAEKFLSLWNEAIA